MLDDIYFMKQALIEAGKAAERGKFPLELSWFVRSGLSHVPIISQKH